MKIKIIILFILIISFCSCNQKQVTENSLGSFDLSKDDKTILFSYVKSNASSIYSMNIDGTNIKLIVKSKNGKSYTNPRYSTDNKRILFIENSISNKKNSTLCIANTDGSNLINLTNKLNIITEAFFRENNNEIIFCKAKEYKNYSPIGRKMAHDFDIYSLNIANKQILQLTNLNAYSINHVTEIDNKIVFQLNSEFYNGIFALSNNNLNIISFMPKNDPQDLRTYSAFLFLPKEKEVIYTKSYDLYKMDVTKKEPRFLFTSNLGIVSLMRKFNSSSKILCSIQNDSNLYIIDKNKFLKNVIPIDL